jgi:hypothetical protein
MGRGADVIIIDDPQAAHEVDDRQDSAAIRAWYDRSIYQRLNDKEDGVVILVMQRLAHDDLTAHLLAQGGWELLRLPAIATEDERFPKLFGDRVIRAKGEALDPARENQAQLREAMLRMRAPAFMAQYQQEPYLSGEGGERCGAFHWDGPEETRKHSPCFLGRVPEERFVLERLFGEPSGIRMGLPPPMTVEEWRNYHNALSRKKHAAALSERGGSQTPE